MGRKYRTRDGNPFCSLNKSSLIIPLLILSLHSTKFIHDIELRGNRVFSKEKLKREVFDFYIGKSLSLENLENLIEDLLSFYEKNGFPFAEIHPVAMREVDDGIDVILSINEGRPAIIRRVLFEGNRHTRESFLKRFFPFENKIFNPDEFEEGKRRLEGMEFILVEEYRFVKGEGVNLVVQLKELESNRIFGGIGYDGERRELLGEFEFLSKNLFGTGRGFNLKWRRISLGEQELHIKYREPFLFSLNFNLYGGIDYEFRDTLFLKKAGFVEGEFLKGKFTFTVGVRYEAIDDLILKRYERDILSIMGVKFDTRFPIYLPRRGILIEGRGEASRIKQRVRAGGRVYIPLSKFTLSLSTQYMDLRRRGEIGPSELFPVGGSGNLRGYRENQFLVKEVILCGIEIDFFPYENFALYPFLDGGILDKKIHYGYGIGLKAPLKGGILNLSYALSPLRSYREGTVHIALEGKI
jgi:outer membrane protein assembly factor BamA